MSSGFGRKSIRLKCPKGTSFLHSQCARGPRSLQWQCRVVAKEIVSWLRFSLSHHHFCKRPRTKFWNAGLPSLAFNTRWQMQYMEKEHAKKNFYFSYVVHIDTKTQGSQEFISNFSFSDSRKYPPLTIGRMNIITTPACLWKLAPHALWIAKFVNPLPFKISVFYSTMYFQLLIFLKYCSFLFIGKLLKKIPRKNVF